MAKTRIDDQPAYVLHTYPYRETSLIVEAFTRDFGRVGLVARGARRPKSAMRGVLLAFVPLEFGWFGEGELHTLARAEWVGGQPLLVGPALLCGYYLNELLLKLAPREDAHPALFTLYADTVKALALRAPPAPLLRRFEAGLLRELGYGLTLDVEADSGASLRPEQTYAYIIDRGVVADAPPSDAPRITGAALLDMAAGRFDNPASCAAAKILMRHLIHHYLGGATLQSRRVFRELQEL